MCVCVYASQFISQFDTIRFQIGKDILKKKIVAMSLLRAMFMIIIINNVCFCVYFNFSLSEKDADIHRRKFQFDAKMIYVYQEIHVCASFSPLLLEHTTATVVALMYSMRIMLKQSH